MTALRDGSRSSEAVPPESPKLGDGKNFTNQRCFFLSFLLAGNLWVAVMGCKSPPLQGQYQEMGKGTPSLSKKEGSGTPLESRARAGGQQGCVLQGKDCWENSVGAIKRNFKGRLAVWVRAVEMVFVVWGETSLGEELWGEMLTHGSSRKVGFPPYFLSKKHKKSGCHRIDSADLSEPIEELFRAFFWPCILVSR